MQIIKELRHGGAETVALRLMQARDATDQAVVSHPGEWSHRFPGRHYSMGQTSMKPRDLISAARSIRHAVKEFRPDVIHAHSPGTLVAARLALGPRTSPVLLGTAHGGYTLHNLSTQAKLYKFLRIPIVSCGPGVTFGLREGGLEPVATINNGIPESALRDTPKRHLAEEFGLDPRLKTAVAVGRLAPVKNHQQMLKAFAQYDRMNLLICGDGESRKELERQARDLGLDGRVRFLGMRQDVPEILHSADVQLLTSRVEGLPMALLEGMSEGKPLIATDVLGSRELVDHGRNGLLVELDDDRSLAEALKRLDTDDSLRETLSVGALETAQQYSVKAMTDRYWDLYSALSAGSPTKTE
ncbi:glycosyltransferase [Curtobacterium sp. S6]|uniref:glycosyltransferase n=1 Tax=Curtobacterium sp. S6 TaxID=1479623 RepID=UPI0006909E43|nr:glycosyltransferase [Curtobacterium sp. S6]